MKKNVHISSLISVSNIGIDCKRRL